MEQQKNPLLSYGIASDVMASVKSRIINKDRIEPFEVVSCRCPLSTKEWLNTTAQGMGIKPNRLMNLIFDELKEKGGI